ncbi:hypothetical protein LJB82_02565 [Desulfovibrio sp. OttesenSCG-928-M16]|nr:hypothetical protein [Desulfovibrio sp. OttesenSCG-928-M16]
MKKHQFVKHDCNCPRRATYFVCKHCGEVEHGSPEDMRCMDAYHATCISAEAPNALPGEVFKSKMGGYIDCLAPDYASWANDN